VGHAFSNGILLGQAIAIYPRLELFIGAWYLMSTPENFLWVTFLSGDFLGCNPANQHSILLLTPHHPNNGGTLLTLENFCGPHLLPDVFFGRISYQKLRSSLDYFGMEDFCGSHTFNIRFSGSQSDLWRFVTLENFCGPPWRFSWSQTRNYGDCISVLENICGSNVLPFYHAIFWSATR
jgi:hypothetical protein